MPTSIDKETLLNRIYNEGGGLERNPYHHEYLIAIELTENYFNQMKDKYVQEELTNEV